MTRDQVIEKIQKELAAAERARSDGNEGMVRVCARRAAGAAIAFWLQSHPRTGWGTDAMNRLHNLQRDDSVPHEVQHAALRLTSRITKDFTSAFSSDPIHDSKVIVGHLVGDPGDLKSA